MNPWGLGRLLQRRHQVFSFSRTFSETPTQYLAVNKRSNHALVCRPLSVFPRRRSAAMSRAQILAYHYCLWWLSGDNTRVHTYIHEATRILEHLWVTGRKHRIRVWSFKTSCLSSHFVVGIECPKHQSHCPNTYKLYTPNHPTHISTKLCSVNSKPTPNGTPTQT